MSQSKADIIKKWEDVERERSASEAFKHSQNDLRIPDHIIERYLIPKESTNFQLEYSYYLLGDVTGLTVLDYGCGEGGNSVILAARGANVIGVDISPHSLELARKRLDAHGYSESTDFRVGSAHELPLEDESVDVVFGMAILHHLDLELSSAEIFRVLKKGGRAIFQEPVRNSKLIKIIRKMIPYETPDLSPYERPLTDEELARYAEPFSEYKSRAFSLPFVNLAEVLRLRESVYRKCVAVDGALLKKIPSIGFYSSIRVVELTK